MQETYFEVRLEAEKRREGHFLLTAEVASAHYVMSLDPAASFEFSDALRRLGPVMAGQSDPSGQLTPPGLMREVGVRLWQALPYMAQAFFLFEVLHAPQSSTAQDMIARIRDRMGDAVFLARWRTLVGDLPVPAPPQA